MKKLFIIVVLLVLSFNLLFAQSIIIDHNCCDLTKIPENYIIQAKQNLRIAYGHTSHGSQIVSGMALLSSPLYSFGISTGQLYFRDNGIPGAGDLGNPDRTSWATSTRNLLNNNTNNINLIIWSWCGQVNTTSENIDLYLNLMSELEDDFPNIRFVYMTGHLTSPGSGGCESGQNNLRNEQIKNYCLQNGKILFDFADIESYNPDGEYFLDDCADDGCNYYSKQGSKIGNWAEEWCSANPGQCGNCSCAHSHCLNCQQKGKAFWWMLARISGWQGDQNIKPEFTTSIQELDFGDISSPESSELSFDILNTGNTYLRISAINIEDNIDSLFKFTTEPIFPIIINASSKKSFAIKFTPPEANGKYSASIKFTTDMDEYAMNLAANYTGGVGVDNLLSNDSKFEVFPNPANDKLSIKFSFTEPQFINILIINLNGISEQQFIRAQKFDTGYHVENINLDNLNSGVYLVRLQLGINVFTKKIIIIK